MSLTDAELHAWIAGALEPPRALSVEEAIRADPLLAARITQLRADLATPAPTDPWRIPPPGVLGGAVGWGLTHQTAAVFGGGLQPGDRFELRLPSLDDATDRRVVVLRQSEAGWRVLFPTAREDRIALADLPTTEGAHVLEVSAGPEPGLQRWAVALPRLSDAIDWAADEITRWAATIAGIASGDIPVASTEVRVG